MDREAGLSGDPRALRLAVVLGVVCLALLFFWRLGAAPLLEPDEGRYTEIPREMLASGDFVTPHLNGVLYFEKPPLHYWLTAAAIRVLGLNEVAARLWSAVFGLAGVWLAYRLGREIGGPRAGVVAAAVLGTSPLYVALGRLATLDMTLSFFLTLTLASFWFAHRDDAADAGKTQWGPRLWWHVMFLAAALAVLTKGLVGVVIPGAVIFLFLLVTGRWRVLRQVPWLTGVALFLAVAVPWHALAAARNPDFLFFYFVHEHFLRYATPVAERQEPFWYFAGVIAVGCLPWSGLLVSVPRLVRWREARRFFARHSEAAFLLLWFGFVFLFFSASQSKLIPYILPALPPLAVLLGLLVDRLRSGTMPASGLETAGFVTAGVLTAAVALFFLWVGLGKVDRLGLLDTVSPVLVVPGLCLLILAGVVAAEGFAHVWRRRLLALVVTGCCLCGAVIAATPLVGRERSSKALAERVRAEMREGDLLFHFECYRQGLPVYLDRTAGVAGYQGELEFGISHLSREERQRRFPNAQEFKKLWDSDRRVLAVGDLSWSRRMAAEGFTHARLLWKGWGTVLLSNDRSVQ
jgi:4-amino-4-deoxy-L-arabinose transferase-like glycosyltransferase